MWVGREAACMDYRELESQPPSLENPFVGHRGRLRVLRLPGSQPPSLENPFVGQFAERIFDARRACLNLQAWRIPLWVKVQELQQ